MCAHVCAASRRRSRSGYFECLESRTLLSATPPTVVDVAVASTEWDSAFYSYLNPGGTGIDGYSIPVGSSAQTAPLPWANIDQIIIQFSEDVLVDITDLALSGISTASYGFDHFYYDPQTAIAVWTLESPLLSDQLLIDLDADGLGAITDLDENLLDGEWTDTQSTFASGNGTEGGDFEFRVNVLPGDVDSSTNVTYYDYANVYWNLGTASTDQGYNAKYDVDGSGEIDSVDMQLVYDELYNSLPSGSPIGLSDDAPSTAGFDLIDIDDDSVDVAISLTDVFDDLEDGNSSLSYSIVSNSAPSLFDNVSINQQFDNLVLNSAASVSGRAAITVRATDSSGQSVESVAYVDVDRDNAPPVLEISAYYVGAYTWIIEGDITDSDDVVDETWIVWLDGVYEARIVVDENGHFEIGVIIEPEITFYDEWGWTFDPHGLISDYAETELGPIT